jgi:hypothetical protein
MKSLKHGGKEEGRKNRAIGSSVRLKSRNQQKIFNYQITNLLNYQIPPFLCVSRFSALKK